MAPISLRNLVRTGLPRPPQYKLMFMLSPDLWGKRVHVRTMWRFCPKWEPAFGATAESAGAWYRWARIWQGSLLRSCARKLWQGAIDFAKWTRLRGKERRTGRGARPPAADPYLWLLICEGACQCVGATWLNREYAAIAICRQPTEEYGGGEIGGIASGGSGEL